MNARILQPKIIALPLLIIVLTVVYFNLLGVNVAHAQLVSAFVKLWGFLGPSVGESILGSVLENSLKGIMWFFYTIAGFLANSAAQLFDHAIQFSLDTANFKLPGVLEGWKIFRDLVNLVFIFILLYLGAATVLQIPGFDTKRVLSSLIVVALLLNFSFFFSGVVIDTANITGGFIYNSIAPVTPGGDYPDDRVYLGETLTEKLRLPETSSFPSSSTGPSPTQEALAFLLSGVVLLIAAFVFLSGFFLFVIRQVVLIFIIVLSPVAFAALILPNTKKHFTKWLGRLINDSFVAPIYLLLIAVTILVADSTEIVANGKNFGEAFTISQKGYIFSDYMGLFLHYALIIGLLLGSLVVAKGMSSEIANMSTKFAGKFIGGAAATAGFVGRHTIGRGASALSGQYGKGWKDKAGNKNLGGFASRMALRTTSATSKANFDARSGKVGSVVGGTVGGVLAAGGIEAKAGAVGGKGGYKARLDATGKKEIEFAKSLGEDEVAVAGANVSKKAADRAKGRAQSELSAAEKRGDSAYEISKYQMDLDMTEGAAERAAESVKSAKNKRQLAHANVLEGSGRAASWIPALVGKFRTRGENKAAGKAVRDEYAKEQSTKDNETLRDAIREAARSNSSTSNDA